jgi:hypothetical protein
MRFFALGRFFADIANASLNRIRICRTVKEGGSKRNRPLPR